jgi:hypothetical protein
MVRSLLRAPTLWQLQVLRRFSRNSLPKNPPLVRHTSGPSMQAVQIMENYEFVCVRLPNLTSSRVAAVLNGPILPLDFRRAIRSPQNDGAIRVAIRREIGIAVKRFGLFRLKSPSSYFCVQ